MIQYPEIDESALGRRKQIGEGGLGIVYALPRYRLDGETHELVYKRLKGFLRLEPNELRALVRFRVYLPPADRDELDATTAWPLQIVLVNERPIGVVMRKAPPEVYSSGSALHRPTLRESLFLLQFGSPYRGWEPPSDRERLQVCERLARSLLLLHRHNRAFGDVSPRNVLYALDPTRVFLIDCDGPAVVGKLRTPMWADLAGDDCSPESDVYKFALFVLRVAAQDQRTSSPRAGEHLLGAGARDLVADSLGRPPGRPSIEEWVHFLERRAPEVDAYRPPPPGRRPRSA